MIFTLRIHERAFLILFALGWTYLCFELGRFNDSGSQGTIAEGLAAAVFMGSPAWCISVWAGSQSVTAGWLRIAVLLMDLPVAFVATLFAWGSISAAPLSLGALLMTIVALSLWYFFYIVYRLLLAQNANDRSTAAPAHARFSEKFSESGAPHHG